MRAKGNWQGSASLQTAGSDPQISPSGGGTGAPVWYNVTWVHMSVPAKWHLIPSNGFCRQGVRLWQMTYVQTDRPLHGNICCSRQNCFYWCRLIMHGEIVWLGGITVRASVSQASTWFTYPEGMEGWVDPGSLIAARPGVKPTTAWSQVWRPNHYATDHQGKFHTFLWFYTYVFYYHLSCDRRISALLHRLWMGCYNLAMGCYALAMVRCRWKFPGWYQWICF